MTTPSELLLAALEQFSSPDESARGAAFSKLSARSTPFLHTLLVSSLPSEQDREDAIQDIFTRIWRSRERLGFSTIGAWWRYLRTMATNYLIDHSRMGNVTLNLEDPEFLEIQPVEHHLVDAVVEAMEDRRNLYRLADEVFLELPANLEERHRTRRLLAAKLLLIEKLPWQEVCRIVNSGAYDDELIDRDYLNALLRDASLMRHVAYSELHWENERLTAYLLDSSRNSGFQSYDRKSYTEDERQAVELRFQFAMMFEQIVSRMGGRLNKLELTAIFDSCVAQFPFVEIMNRLLTDVGQFEDARRQLGTPGLWNRIVFQYYCHNGLTHRDICDRTGAASKIAGYEVTLGKLNVGLSNGRLFKKMADHLAERENR